MLTSRDVQLLHKRTVPPCFTLVSYLQQKATTTSKAPDTSKTKSKASTLKATVASSESIQSVRPAGLLINYAQILRTPVLADLPLGVHVHILLFIMGAEMSPIC